MVYRKVFLTNPQSEIVDLTRKMLSDFVKEEETLDGYIVKIKDSIGMDLYLFDNKDNMLMQVVLFSEVIDLHEPMSYLTAIFHSMLKRIKEEQ